MNLHEANLILFKNKEVFDGYIEEIKQEAVIAFSEKIKQIKIVEELSMEDWKIFLNQVDRILAETLLNK